MTYTESYHQPKCSVNYHFVNKTKITSFTRKQILCYGTCRHYADESCSGYSQKLIVLFSIIPEIKYLIIHFWTCNHLHTSGNRKVTGNILICAANTLSLLSAMAPVTSKAVYLRRGNKICNMYPITFLPTSCHSPWELWGAAQVPRAFLRWNHTAYRLWRCSEHDVVRSPGWQQDEAIDTISVTHRTGLLVYENTVKFHVWNDWRG